jgi:hypothetical protein
MKKFFCLIALCVSIVVFLNLFVYGSPCRPGGPNGNLYRLDSKGEPLLDSGQKIPVPGYMGLEGKKRCCDKVEKPACKAREFSCEYSTYRYYHNTKPYKLGKCKKELSLFCKKCYYDDSLGRKIANKPACEIDHFYDHTKNPSLAPCHRKNFVKTIYEYGHSSVDDCF